MGGMNAKPKNMLAVDADRHISCTHGSVTMSGEWISVYQLSRKTTETFTSPGSCPNVSKRAIDDLWGDGLVCKSSSVIWGKVWGPWNDDIPFKDNFLKFEKGPSRRPGGSSKVCSWWFVVRISKDSSVGMGSHRCPAISSKPDG